MRPGRYSWLPLAPFLLLVSILPGCSGSGVVGVGGEVTFDGEPVDRGTIRMVAVDGKTPSAEAVIRDGRYQMEVVPGEKRVEIQGFRVVGEARRNDDPSAPLEEVTEPIVPARFNSQSELVLEISGDAASQDFHLTSR